MKLAIIAEFLWGNKAKFKFLLLASVILIFTFLGSREIWTQEHRWADIVAGMFFRQDFLHPYLGQSDYYDKPLLSYWLIALFAKLNHTLTTWPLRLPSALAGLLAIWSIYRLGRKLGGKELGLLSGWLLLTSYYFVFWSRTSSADMLNLAGSLFAIAWYFEKKDHAGFFSYLIFFVIAAATSLCKGLIGAIVPLIAVAIDISLQQSWKKHLRLPMFLAFVPALLLYLAPFFASSFFGGNTFSQNGLYLVYRENILRYFQPFDHEAPLYTYFIYLPVYTLPAALFLFPALLSLPSRWKNMQRNSQWIAWTLLALFVFLTLSGSRRSYYVLPLVPFAILFIADWILSETGFTKKKLASTGLIIFSFMFLYLMLDLFPAWYYVRFGAERFAVSLKHEAEKTQPWKNWKVVMLDAESKFTFYLKLPPATIRYNVIGIYRKDFYTEDKLFSMWPALKNPSENTIFISRKIYAPVLKNILSDYIMFQIPYPTFPFLKKSDTDVPVAFIPNRHLSFTLIKNRYKMLD